jgi:hypothetical protein
MKFKNIAIFILILIVIGSLFWIGITADNSDARESILISLILTIASVVASWLMSTHFVKESSRSENEKLIDGIGEKSSEKILNQSKQLYSLEQYLDEKQGLLNSSKSYTDAKIYLESTRNMIRLIRSSNNTYFSDWAGVVSDKLGEKINKQSNIQSKLFDDIDLLGYSTPEQQEKLKEEIKESSRELPNYLAPKTVPLKGNHAELVSQDVIEKRDNYEKGKLTISLNDDSFKGHIVGKLNSTFSDPPKRSEAKITKQPDLNPDNVSILAKTGTTFDFHVNLKSYEYNEPLKAGVYEVEYEFETE